MQFNQLNSPLSAQRNKLVKSRLPNNIVKSAWDGEINVSMYNDPPMEDITLTEFDEIAQERLSILKIVEEIKEKHTFGTTEYKKALEDKLKKKFPIALETPGITKDMLIHWRRRDKIGHFILRLAFCRNSEQMKWFINQEVDLLRFRFNHLVQRPEQQKAFLIANNIGIDIVSDEERAELNDYLEKSFGSLEQINTIKCYFKLPFQEATDLVRRRKAFLRKGIAYIHPESLTAAICGILRANLISTMTRMLKQLAVIEEENRILPRLTRLSNNAYTGKTYEGAEKSNTITRHQIDQLCINSFPPCMKQIHQRFRADHHIRHGARRQYGSFLKGIGLSLEEALLFMREEFTKKIDSDKFEKQYAYNIRHMYGKEGKRVAATAMPCSTIILGNPPAAGDCHGCPFKHNETALLTQRLKSSNLSSDQISQIIDLTKVSAYDKACTRFFEFSHKMELGALGQLITHPNEYFELSKAVLDGVRAKDNHIHASHPQLANSSEGMNFQEKNKRTFNPHPAPSKDIVEERTKQFHEARIKQSGKKSPTKEEVNIIDDPDSDW